MSQSIAFEVTVSAPYDKAIEKTTDALKTEGFGILTRIDVKQTLKEKINADFRPYAILGACNPPLAHRALSHDGHVGLMLPCNVTVEAKDDKTSIVRIGDPDAFPVTDVGVRRGAGELGLATTPAALTARAVRLCPSLTIHEGYRGCVIRGPGFFYCVEQGKRANVRQISPGK